MSAVLNDPTAAFLDAIAAAGLEPPTTIDADGELHRFSSSGKRGDDAGWYRLHIDGVPAGAFGCWRAGISETWSSGNGREFTPAERREFARRMAALREQRAADGKRRHAEAAAKAAEIWNAASPASDHRYLSRKGIGAHGVRVHDGRIVVPVRDAGSNLTSLQFIAEDGSKRFLTGGKMAGGYFAIGKPDGVLCVCEGFATAASIREATGYAVACAFNAGNLLPVAKTLRANPPGLKLIICADDDAQTEGNPGLTKAREAAEATGAYLAVPDFGIDRPEDATDFNDLHAARGLPLVWTCIEQGATMVEPSEGRRPANGRAPIIYRRLADVKPEPIDWLWQGRIAKGKVSIIAGNPGLGKSQIAAAIAATCTVGGKWPVDRTGVEVGNVIFISAEDDAADTIRPRLDAAGADVSKVYILDAIRETTDDGETRRAFSLKSDLENLEAMVTEIGGAALVVVDPISAYLGSADSHKNAEVRALLAPLSDMAARLHIAVVGVSHLNKSTGGDALSRVTGSLAFVAAARAAYIVSKDPDNESRRLFLPAKNNIGPDQTGLAFTIEGFKYENIETSRVMWEPDPVELSADEAVIQHDPEERHGRADAKQFLLKVLRPGPVTVKRIQTEAKEAGIAWRTLERAKAEVGAKSVKATDGWVWSLPESKSATGSGSTTENQGLNPQDRQQRQSPGLADLAVLDPEGDPPEAEKAPDSDRYTEAF